MNVHIHFSFNSLNTRSKYPIPRHGIQIQTQLLFTNGSLSEMTDRKPCRLRSDRHIQPGPLSATCLDWHLICGEDATSSTPNFALVNCRDMQSSLKKITAGPLTIFHCSVSHHQITRKALLRNRSKKLEVLAKTAYGKEKFGNCYTSCGICSTWRLVGDGSHCNQLNFRLPKPQCQ